jgi:hypothetical protein
MLAEIQQACADYLNGSVTPSGLTQVTFFSASPTIKVLTEQLADYESAIEREVESLGLCLLILTVTADKSQNQFPAGLAFEDIDIRARVLCDPALNKTGVPPSSAAEAAAWYLRKLTPLSGGGSPALESIELVEDRAAPLAYDAIFSLSAKSTTAPSRST